MAFGIHADLASTAVRRVLLLGIALGRAWLGLGRWVARNQERHTLAELDDRSLRDIGLIRDRDIGVSRETAVHKATMLFLGR